MATQTVKLVAFDVRFWIDVSVCMFVYGCVVQYDCNKPWQLIVVACMSNSELMYRWKKGPGCLTIVVPKKKKTNNVFSANILGCVCPTRNILMGKILTYNYLWVICFLQVAVPFQNRLKKKKKENSLRQ